MSAVDDWKEDVRGSDSIDEVIAKSARWIESLDNLVEHLTQQVVSLRAGELQWRMEGQDPTEGHPMFGCAGKMPDGMKPGDAE